MKLLFLLNAIVLSGVAMAGPLSGVPSGHPSVGEAAQARTAVADVAALRRRLVTTAACQAAIKINHPLTDAGMGQLLTDLAGTANPTTCPHGRPILFRLSLDEIERGFRRR